MGTWRDSAKAVIADVVKDNPGLDEKELRKKLREAYPFGERAMHPYKIWCDQVKKTLNSLYRKSKNGIITEGLFQQTEKYDPFRDPNQLKIL